MGIFFRESGERHGLAVAMTGVKLGDRLLHIGCTDSAFLAAISAKVGMSGRASAIVTSDAEVARTRRGAERGGVLLEIEKGTLSNFPYDSQSFDLIVVDSQEGLLSGMRPEQRVATLREAFRTLVPRGRIVVVERAPRGGLGTLWKPSRSVPVDPHYQASGGAIAALRAEGFKAVRQLAERDGLSFFEGVR
jgi:ubiquinone/menaquinone biosynthesis C-methylase UbiE